MRSVNVSIFPCAANALRESAMRHAPNETGGVLVGTRCFRGDVLDYGILGILCIADFDEFKDTYIATPTKFVCTDRMGWANLALKAVETFGLSYIGDWHSHPGSSLTTLSSQDISFIAEQHAQGQFNPYPPLHVLTSWSSPKALFHVSANVMLGELIAILKPQLVSN